MSRFPERLRGAWRFTRQVPGLAHMEGAARFADGAAQGLLRYSEEGRLVLQGGQGFDAARSYIFAPDATGFLVYFDETPLRLFHRVELATRGETLCGEAVHLCGDDRYDSFYEFRPNGEFTIRHAVRGPRKGYTITTLYRQMPA